MPFHQNKFKSTATYDRSLLFLDLHYRDCCDKLFISSNRCAAVSAGSVVWFARKADSKLIFWKIDAHMHMDPT